MVHAEYGAWIVADVMGVIKCLNQTKHNLPNV